MTVLTIAYISYDPYRFVSKTQRFIEITSEMLLLLASILIWQIMRTSDRDEKEKIGQWIFGSLGLLILINAVYITHTAISNWLRKRRIRALKKKHDEAMEKRKT